MSRYDDEYIEALEIEIEDLKEDLIMIESQLLQCPLCGIFRIESVINHQEHCTFKKDLRV